MRSIDTNILARWVLGDDEEQSLQAEEILSGQCFIPASVILETGWVLHKKAGLTRSQTATMLETIVALETATIDRADRLAWAIGRFRLGADWADMLHLVYSVGIAAHFVTFDRRLERQAGSTPPLPIQTIGTEA